jgi:D-serine deaminase-like pyridoxal phosphate-dependent protein
VISEDRLLDLDVDTPALLLDLDRLESNIESMAAFARRNGFSLRPHAKTHKSANIARLQMSAGAIGVCCAKLSEAEALAHAGIEAIAITSNVIGPQKVDRLHRLHSQIADLMVVADNPEVVTVLSARHPQPSRKLPVLIDLDVGLHRSGVVSVGDAIALARQIERASGLRFAGVQAYAGHVQQIVDRRQRQAEAAKSAATLQATVSALAEAGLPCKIVTGGGTGTYAIDPEFRIFTDLQVGSYVFMDVEYLSVDSPSASDPWFKPSLFVISQVVSAAQGDHVTIDAGSKSVSLDGPMPWVVAPRRRELRYALYGDEFGMVGPESGPAELKLGDRVVLLTPHCDPTVNLHAHYTCFRGKMITDLWPIEARGLST